MLGAQRFEGSMLAVTCTNDRIPITIAIKTGAITTAHIARRMTAGLILILWYNSLELRSPRNQTDGWAACEVEHLIQANDVRCCVDCRKSVLPSWAGRSWMIRILSWLVIVAIFVAGSVAKGEERLPFLGGDGATACQDWINARAAKLSDTKPDGTNLILSFALESWVLGFISAISEESSRGARKIEQTLLCETNDADVLGRVDNFCRANPTSVIFQGVLHVSADLMRNKTQQIRRALEMDRAGIRSGPNCWANPPR
jgi:hypothetical protein